MNLPSWDVFLTIFFIIGIAYGFLIQRDKIIVSLISVYIAIVVTNSFAGVVQQFFVGDKVLFGQVWIRANASLLTIQIIIFALTIFFVSARSGFLTKKTRGAGLPPIEILAYSFFNTVLIISSIISFLPPATRQHLIESSKLASRIMNLQLWWIVLPVILLVFTGFSRESSRGE